MDLEYLLTAAEKKKKKFNSREVSFQSTVALSLRGEEKKEGGKEVGVSFHLKLFAD